MSDFWSGFWFPIALFVATVVMSEVIRPKPKKVSPLRMRFNERGDLTGMGEIYDGEDLDDANPYKVRDDG